MMLHIHVEECTMVFELFLNVRSSHFRDYKGVILVDFRMLVIERLEVKGLF